MVVRMRHTRSHTRNRRSHHALKSASFRACVNCKAPVMPHTVCASCGQYRGRRVLDVVAKAEKKQKKSKAKQAEAAR